MKRTTKRIPLSLLAVAGAWMLASVASAAPPQSITSLTIQNSLDEQDEQRIAEYVQYWTQRLHQSESEGYDMVITARDKLEEPMNAPGLRGAFRNKYSSELVPGLLEVARSEPPYSAINALRVIGSLGTKQALDALTDELRADPEDVRLWAAKSIRTMVDEMVAANDMRVRDSDLNRAARAIGRATESETNWLVMLRQLEALDAIDVMLRKLDSSLVSSEAQDRLLEALDRSVTMMMESGDGPSSLMQTVYRTVVGLRDTYLNLNMAQKDALGPRLASTLGRILEVAQAHWAPAHADVASSASYHGTLGVCEQLLRLIDKQAREGQAPPSTQLSDAWNKDDLERFEQYLGQWATILSAPPYASR